MVWSVELLDHKKDEPELAVSVTEEPLHISTVPAGVIVGVGNGFTVIVVEGEVPVQPFASVTVTE